MKFDNQINSTSRIEKFDELLKTDLDEASKYARQVAEYYKATIQQENQNDGNQQLTSYEKILNEVENQTQDLEQQYKNAQELEQQNNKEIELIMDKNIDIIH